jgi:ketosteroid isomerase-like protein
MKKEIFIGLVLLLVLNFSCQQKPERWTATSPEIEITKALVKDYETANWSAWILHYADTAKIHHNSVQRISPQQLKQSFEKSTANFSTYKFSEKDMFVEMIIDDKMNKWVYFWGTWEGKIIGSDKELKVPVHLALKFVDSKIVEEYGYYDNTPMNEIFNEIEIAKLAEQGSFNNLNIITNLYKSFEKGDVPSVLASLDEKVEWNEAENFPYADGNPYIGPEAVLNGVFARIDEDWNNFKLTNIQFSEMKNGMVLATGRYMGKYKKNNAPLNAQFAHVWSLTDGKASKFQQYADTQQTNNVINQ